MAMADEADLAFDSEQRHLTSALAAQRSRVRALKAVGCCHYCGNTEGVDDRLFCDSDCATDWDYEDALRRRLGLPATPVMAQAAAGERQLH
jgi:predicted nucleic acid binding AN1-type Zn finger protein